MNSPSAAAAAPSDAERAAMAHALGQAQDAAALGEVPVGAVILDPATGRIVAAAGNATRTGHDVTAHAEMLAIRRACTILGQERLWGLSLVVTLEPCAMCAAAISHARLARLIYGAADPKSGAVDHGPRLYTHPQLHHRPRVIAGVMAEDCSDLLSGFFRALRAARRPPDPD